MIKLTVSIATFDEIAQLLEQQGLKVNDGKQLILEKGTFLVPPIDFRLATIRRDCVMEAAKIYVKGVDDNFIDLVNEIYQYVVFGKKDEKLNLVINTEATEKKEWK